MRMEKRVLCEERVRRVPARFSWVDHRIVRDGYIRRCSASAWGLYLFLTTVGDAEGLSYYSDRSVCRELSITTDELVAVRNQLVEQEMLVWESPLYQVLSVPERRQA
jgi:hypothetical protein